MFSLVLWLQSNPYQHIGDLDSFQEHVLLVVVGALVTSVGTLVFYIIRQSTDREQRARDRAALSLSRHWTRRIAVAIMRRIAKSAPCTEVRP